MKQASATLDDVDMHIWLAENAEELHRAGIEVHPSRLDLGKRLVERNKPGITSDPVYPPQETEEDNEEYKRQIAWFIKTQSYEPSSPTLHW